MESLLRGLVTSTKHKAAFKNQFLTKMFANLEQTYLSPADCIGLYKLFFEWILSSDQPNLIQHGHEQLVKLANRRSDIFREFVNPNLLIDVFTNTTHSNKKDTIILVGEILDILNLPEDAGEPQNDDEKNLSSVYCNIKDAKISNDRENEDLHRSVTNVARSHLINVLRDHGVHMEVSAALGKLYKDHPELLPIVTETRDWIATTVVKLLAGYRPKQSTSVNSPTPVDEAFITRADSISGILPLIWGQSTNTHSITECLHIFYDIISTSDAYTRPSCALLSVIKQIPSHLLNDAMEAMIGNHSQLNKSIPSLLSTSQIQNHAEKEGRTVTALQTMTEWLCERPSVLLSDKLRLLFFRLRQCNRNSVLIEITHATIEKLLLTLPLPALQTSTECLFFFFLLGFQHSETVFHQIVTILPVVFKELWNSTKDDNSTNSPLKSAKTPTQVNCKTILERLKEAVQFFILKFPEFSQLYSPLYQWLDPTPLLSKNRIEELQSLSWLSDYNTNLSCGKSHTSTSSISSISGIDLPDNFASSIPKPCISLGQNSSEVFAQRYLPKQRSATGMVGLINLGNTCYMNSVLQALYITDMFREIVLMAPVQTSSQKVLDKLQQTFAFLRNTMRAIYSPSNFLKVARPPWFEPGRQQDCSEFLRYLLDSLHEQKKSQKGEVVVYGEHQVIETHNTTGYEQNHINEDNEEFAQTPTNEIPDNVNSTILLSAGQINSIAGNCKGVRASYSNTALDSISEAPEIIEPDEDMISQGSAAVQGEDLVFGSRGSLSMDTNKHLVEPELSDDSENEEGDRLGSRDSLGLVRWTTEENLSFGGSKEDKMDLIDGATINDSHSNSTDSGIQSVGDSIRGSSDSMSNQTPPNAENIASGSTYFSSAKNHNTQYGKPKGTEHLPTPQEQTPFVSLVQRVFGGKMQTSYECYNCNSVSIHKEYFTDFLLAFPDPKEEKLEHQSKEGEHIKTGAKDNQEVPISSSNTKTREISVQQLINLYLGPEKLTGENQYHCNKCKSLQDGIKTLKVLEGPEHLMCTLMRFKYDRTHNRKSKVFTDVKYELDLNIPVTTDQENRESLQNGATRMKKSSEKKISTECNILNDFKNVSKQKSDKINDEIYKTQNHEELYTLYAIVVHSGYSSDGGHYYTYAKVPKKRGQQEQASDCGDDLWYIFNDSKVSYSNFESFLSLSKKFPVDTAYVLFYQKVKHRGDKLDAAGTVKASLRTDLKMTVESDNIKFMREKERSAVASSSVSSITSLKGSRQKEDDDDDEGGGGSYGSSCGGDAGFNSPGRFVC